MSLPSAHLRHMWTPLWKPLSKWPRPRPPLSTCALITTSFIAAPDTVEVHTHTQNEKKNMSTKTSCRKPGGVGMGWVRESEDPGGSVSTYLITGSNQCRHAYRTPQKTNTSVPRRETCGRVWGKGKGGLL